MAWPKKLKLKKREEWDCHCIDEVRGGEAILQQRGEWGGGFCQNAECSGHQGPGEQGEQEVNWGLSLPWSWLPPVLSLSHQLNPAPAQPWVPRGQQWLSSHPALGSLTAPPYYTVEFEESTTRFQLDTLLTASLPGAPGDSCSESRVRNLTLCQSLSCFIPVVVEAVPKFGTSFCCIRDASM